MARATTTRLAAVAEDQWGLVTRRQVEAAGISKATVQRLATDHVLERIAQGVYHLAGSPEPDHRELRAAWLQLAPDVPAWERSAGEGVVSHRSAAALFGLGHLPADRHDFIVPARRQSRRRDVRLHVRRLEPKESIRHRGLIVTRPARTAADLLDEKEDPEAVGHVIADAIRSGSDDPVTFAEELAPLADLTGLRRGDGIGVLGWLLNLVGDRDTASWIEQARVAFVRRVARA
jgi:predicted transcriptional regulator of viral defense system